MPISWTHYVLGSLIKVVVKQCTGSSFLPKVCCIVSDTCSDVKSYSNRELSSDSHGCEY